MGRDLNNMHHPGCCNVINLSPFAQADRDKMLIMPKLKEAEDKRKVVVTTTFWATNHRA